MNIFELEERTPKRIEQLLAVQEQSVRATHLFISDEEINQIKAYVLQALSDVAHLVIAESESGEIAAFLGTEHNRLEMLFLHRKKEAGDLAGSCFNMELKTMI